MKYLKKKKHLEVCAPKCKQQLDIDKGVGVKLLFNIMLCSLLCNKNLFTYNLLN